MTRPPAAELARRELDQIVKSGRMTHQELARVLDVESPHLYGLRNGRAKVQAHHLVRLMGSIPESAERLGELASRLELERLGVSFDARGKVKRKDADFVRELAASYKALLPDEKKGRKK